ncbi:hypothetical protein D3C75_1110460 [compost metagenome]
MDAVGYGKAHETDHSTRLFYYAVRDLGHGRGDARRGIQFPPDGDGAAAKPGRLPGGDHRQAAGGDR